ncbi:MAG: helix-turn-helix transcriptional regulator [Azospirillaceae bacterium]|nr:helix-turn-helix transcriptional regulator [Azospirillaceae bacterium]
MSNVASGNSIASVAALIGDVARANILSALMGGLALTAGELAQFAGVTAQTTSGHLARLTDAGLIAMARQGRHRYYRLATPEIAQAMQALMAIAADGPKRHHPIGPRDKALRLARTCYDHLAGRLALALVDGWSAQGYVILADGAGLVTDEGRQFLGDFGIDLDAAPRSRHRPLCRTCLDWSERRPHLAGQLGAAVLGRLLELGWIARLPDTRALRITRTGEQGFVAQLHLAADWMERSAAAPGS